MTTLQIAMTDKEYKYVKEMLNKAQGSFQLDGIKYPMGKTIIKVLEEWSRSKDFIKETKGDRDRNKATTLFKNDPAEIANALGLIKRVERYPNETNVNSLMDLVLRLDANWVIPRGEESLNLNKALIVKMREMLK